MTYSATQSSLNALRNGLFAASLSLLAPSCAPGAGAGDGGSSEASFVPAGNFSAPLPCRFTTDLDLFQGRLLGVCSRLHGFDRSRDTSFFYEVRRSASGFDQVTIRTDLNLPNGRSLNQIVPTRSGRGLITANDGFYVADLEGAGNPQFIFLPPGHAGAVGAAFSGNSVFVTAHFDDGTPWGRSGELLVYDVDASGNVLEESERDIEMSTHHPTAVALRADGTLIVLNRGDATLNLPATIDRIDTVRERNMGGLLLPEGVGFQRSGELALSEDGGTAVLGTADGSGRLYFADLHAGPTDPVPYIVLPGTFEHSSLKVRGRRVYVTDFTYGSISVVDIPTRALIETYGIAGSDGGGSEFVEDSLFQAGARSLYSMQVP